MPYRNATICKNGHIVSYSQAKVEKYCSKCGAITYSSCPKCGARIRGVYENPNVIYIGSLDYELPHYCYQCSKPYPWTQQILDNAVELLALDPNLDDESKELIKTAIPGLLVDSPSTPVAVAQYKAGIKKAADFIGNALRQVLVDVVSEAAKKVLFP